MLSINDENNMDTEEKVGCSGAKKEDVLGTIRSLKTAVFMLTSNRK